MERAAKVATTCSYPGAEIEPPDGRRFAIPDPGYSVELHALTIEGENSPSDIFIERSANGSITARLLRRFLQHGRSSFAPTIANEAGLSQLLNILCDRFECFGKSRELKSATR
jgi:hypothetical protein